MAADDIALGVSLDTADFLAKMDAMNRRLDEFATHTATAEKAGGGLFSGISGGIAKFGLMAAGVQAAAGAVMGLADAFTQGNSEFEQYNVRFQVLLGSAEAAQTRMAELADFAQKTPFELNGVVKADTILQGFGLHSEEAARKFGFSGNQIRTIAGDVASGTGASFEEMATLIGKFASGATGEAISRMQELGITNRQTLSDMGLQFSKAGELLSPLPQAMQVILQQMQEKYGGLMDAQSKTFGGMVSNLQDWISSTQRTLTAPIFDVLKQKLQDLLTVLSSPAVQAGIAQLAVGIAQFTAAALDFIGTVAGMVAGVIQFTDSIGLTGPILTGLATGAVVMLTTAFAGLAGSAASAAVAMVIATAPITVPLLAIAAAVAALKVAWDNDFLGMKTTITDWADWANQEVDRVVQHDAGSPYWMKKYGADIEATKQANALGLAQMVTDTDVGTEAMAQLMMAGGGKQLDAVTGAVDAETAAWQQAQQKQLAIMHQQNDEAAVLAIANANAVYDPHAQNVDRMADAGWNTANAYLVNLVNGALTGMPAVDDYIKGLLAKHDIAGLMGILGKNAAAAYIVNLNMGIAADLEKVAADMEDVHTGASMKLAAHAADLRKNAIAFGQDVGALPQTLKQYQTQVAEHLATVKKHGADLGKTTKAMATQTKVDLDAVGKALANGLQAAAQAAATNGPAQALSGMIDLMKSATDAKMPAIASTIQGWLNAAAKGAGPSAQAIHDQVVAWLTKLESSGNTHMAAFARAALDQLTAFTADAQAKLDAAAQERNDKAGKAAADALSKQLETQQAQRDLQQQMVDDATKNYQAYADAVKKGYETAGDAMSAAVQRQLEDNQRMRDAQAAQQQAAQQLAQSLAGVATAMQDHSKTALDIMQQLGPLAQQAAAAGAGGLAQVINTYMQQAATGANVNMQDVYQAITGWLQQATQSGDAMLAVFARNALQHLAISQQIQAATDSLIPFQSAVDGARASLENANQAVQEAQDAVGRYRTELQSAQDDLRHFTQAPLEGEHAFSEQLFANQQAQAALQLRINQMMAGGANSQNPQLKALQTQLENLRRAGENIRLQEQLTIGQQRHDLENQANGPPQEISAGDAAAGIDAAKARIDAANAALNTAQDRLTSLQRVQAGAQQAVADATAAFNAQQAAVQQLTAQLQAGAPAVQQFGTALGTGLGTMGPAAQTALGAVDTAFGAVFGTGQGGQGGQGGQVGSIMQLLFAHDENAFFAKLDQQTNERLDGYTAGTWASKLTILDERISDGLGTIKQTAVDLATGIGTAIGDGMVAGIQSAAAAVAAAAVAVVQGAIAAAQAAAQVHSPSKKFAEIGAYMGQGMAQGLAGQGPAVASASAGLANQAAGAAVATVPVGGVGGAGTAALPAINFTAYLLDPFGGQRQLQVLREEMAYAQYSATRSTP